MRYLILADIHSNLEAFTAVLEDAQKQGGFDQIWCLGDMVGYGPDPHACLELLRRYPHVAVAGNHDWGAIGKVDTSEFNPDAEAACHWTAQQLDPGDVAYLEELPLSLEIGDFTLVHGSPREPIWEYLVTLDVAQANLAYFHTPYCLVGHSHLPLAFETQSGKVRFLPLPPPLPGGKRRLIINPGALGQPRDGDARASYLLYQSHEPSLVHRRVPYALETTQRKMLEKGLPPGLARRLSYGR